jgi:hypothetical protein
MVESELGTQMVQRELGGGGSRNSKTDLQHSHKLHVTILKVCEVVSSALQLLHKRVFGRQQGSLVPGDLINLSRQPGSKWGREEGRKERPGDTTGSRHPTQCLMREMCAGRRGVGGLQQQLVVGDCVKTKKKHIGMQTSHPLCSSL